MKLSLATLILAVAVGTQAASLNPMEKRGVVTDPLCKPLTNCLHKVCNTNSGTGYLGYCCVSDKDCIASCVDNKCTGKRNPKFADPITTTTKAAKTTTKKTTKKTTKTTKKTSKAGAITDPLCKPLTNCIHKTCNTGNGTGYKGYCCVSDKDCIASCVNNKCTGKSNPKFADPITTTTKAAKKTTKKTSKAGAITDPLCKPLTNCIHKTCNTGNGTGYKGYCCVSDKDCIASCVNNKCTGKSNPKFADPIN